MYFNIFNADDKPHSDVHSLTSENEKHTEPVYAVKEDLNLTITSLDLSPLKL